jgi:hypothetical protein
LWVVKVAEDDGELRPWHYIYEGRHYIYVYSTERRLIWRVIYESRR